MHASAPSSLDSAALSRRLGELAGHERAVQVEFLLHLEEFDTRRAWAEAGYGSLWDYLLRVLHLREGAAFRRIAAMRVLRRLPVVAEALRDGRLCLSTVAVLGPLLTEENVGELVARAAFLTKAEVERLAASLQPRVAPRDGLRLRPSSAAPPREHPPSTEEPPEPTLSAGNLPEPQPSFAPAPPPSRTTLHPVDAENYSLCVTVDTALKKDLEELKALLSHKLPRGDLAAVLREAVQCALEKHRKRRGAAEPARKRKSPVAAKPAKQTVHGRQPIPAAVRREVWKRDEGRCTTSSGGRTWSCSGPRRRPERVKALLPADVAAPHQRCERVRSFAAGASTGPATNVSRRTEPSRTGGSASRTTIARQHRTASVLPLAQLRPSRRDEVAATARDTAARVASCTRCS